MKASAARLSRRVCAHWPLLRPVILAGATFAAGSLWGTTGIMASSIAIGTAIAAWTLHICGNSFSPRRPTIAALWLFAYVPMIAIPAVVLASDPSYRARSTYFLSVTSALLTVPLGALLVAMAANYRNGESQAFFERAIALPANQNRSITLYFLMLGGAILLSANYVREAGVPPILVLIKSPGDYHLLRELREDSFKLLASPFKYAYFVLRSFFWPALVAISLAHSMLVRGWTWRILATITMISALVFASLSSAKLPVAATIAVAFLVVLILRGRSVRLHVLVIMPLVVLSFPLAVVLLLQAGWGYGVWFAVFSVLNRLFFVPSYVLYHYFEIFPDQIPYLHGATSGLWARVIGVPNFDSAHYVFGYLYPHEIQSGLANAAFLGNAWADFGAVGVVLSGITLGMIMQTLQLMIIRSQKSVDDVAMFAFLLYAFWMANSTALPQVLMSNGVILAVALRFVMNWINSARKTTFPERH